MKEIFRGCGFHPTRHWILTLMILLIICAGCSLEKSSSRADSKTENHATVETQKTRTNPEQYKPKPTVEPEFVFVAVDVQDAAQLSGDTSQSSGFSYPGMSLTVVPSNPYIPQPNYVPNYQPPVTMPQPNPNPPSIPWQPPVSRPILPPSFYP